MKKSPYNAEISAGSLLVRESQRIAKLLIKGVDEQGWHKAVIVDNVLQKKSPPSAKRMARLVRNRLELMTPDLWKLVASGSSEVATQALLATSIKHSHLLGDFMKDVIRDHWRTYNKQLSARDWTDYFEECEHRDRSLGDLSESTKRKLGQVVFRILAEAKYIDSTRKMNLLPHRIIPEIYRYLVDNNEKYVLRCMEIGQ